MSLTISEKSKGPSVPMLEAGTYSAVCCELIDLGLQYNEEWKSSSRKVLIGWEVVGETVNVNGEAQPRIFSKTYTMSLNEKAALRKDLNAWRGRPFTEEELKAFDLRSIVGAACMLTIVHQTSKNGRTYANLASIGGIPKGFPKPGLTVDPTIYDIDENDPAVVNTLPAWIADIIKQSPSYTERVASYSPLQELPDADDGELPF
ncbi:MAG: hypothetical protein II595_04455 [Desulfovibrio sp.]|nr:hypothetical protein [Desulfovibrio sp.]